MVGLCLCLAPLASIAAEGENKPDTTIKADPVRTVMAVRRQGEFKLDGLLDEKFWSEAPSADGFKQTWPKEGQHSSESTLVKLAYDDEALYVGIINTNIIAAVGIVTALVLGFIVGIGRLSSNWLVRSIATVYVETFRNIPPLLQIFFWYFGVLSVLPQPKESIILPLGSYLNSRGVFLSLIHI